MGNRNCLQNAGKTFDGNQMVARNIARNGPGVWNIFIPLLARKLMLSWTWLIGIVTLLILVGWVWHARQEKKRQCLNVRIVPHHLDLFHQRQRYRQTTCKHLSRLD